jgi:NACalpha-BTF3-like transcription factor
MKTKEQKADKRPANFTPEEDVFLSQAYVNVSLDPAIGANQSAKLFGTRLPTSIHCYIKKRAKYNLSKLHHVNLLPFRLDSSAILFRKIPSCFKHITSTMPTRSQAAGMKNIYSRVPVQGSVGLKDESLNLIKQCVPILQTMVKFQAACEESITQPTRTRRCWHSEQDRQGESWVTPPFDLLGKQKKAKQLMKDAATTVLSTADTSLAVDRVAVSTEKLAIAMNNKNCMTCGSNELACG